MMKHNLFFSLILIFGLFGPQIGKTQVSIDQEVGQKIMTEKKVEQKTEQKTELNSPLKNPIKMTSPLKKATERMVICRSTQAVRTLRIENNSGGHCQTFYTKAGIDQNIGKSQSIESCMEYLNKVRGTLEKAQWACKDVKLSTLSTMTESVN